MYSTGKMWNFLISIKTARETWVRRWFVTHCTGKGERECTESDRPLPAVPLELLFWLYFHLKAFPWIVIMLDRLKITKHKFYSVSPSRSTKPGKSSQKEYLSFPIPNMYRYLSIRSHVFSHCLPGLYKQPLYQFQKNPPCILAFWKKSSVYYIRFYFLLDSHSKSTDLIGFSSNIHFAEQKLIWNSRLQKCITQASRIGKPLSPPSAAFLGPTTRPGRVRGSYLTCYNVDTDYSRPMTSWFDY